MGESTAVARGWGEGLARGEKRGRPAIGVELGPRWGAGVP